MFLLGRYLVPLLLSATVMSGGYSYFVTKSKALLRKAYEVTSAELVVSTESNEGLTAAIKDQNDRIASMEATEKSLRVKANAYRLLKNRLAYDESCEVLSRKRDDCYSDLLLEATK